MDIGIGNYPDWISAIANCVMAAGVILVFWQIWLTKKQATTAFEDNMAKEYRELAARIPTRALLGEDLSQEEYKQTFDEFYHYVDLSNEEIFLRQRNRVSEETWVYWLDGIKSNLSRPAFKRAWEEIKARNSDSFNELRRVEKENFRTDPHTWR
jgi:hypothetical protein